MEKKTFIYSNVIEEKLCKIIKTTTSYECNGNKALIMEMLLSRKRATVKGLYD